MTPHSPPVPADTMKQWLDEVDIVPLAMSLVQLSGDLSLLDEVSPFVKGAWDHMESLPPELKASIRDRLAAEMERLERGGEPRLPVPSSDIVQRMMSTAVGEPVPGEYIPMLLQQMSPENAAGDAAWRAPPQGEVEGKPGETQAPLSAVIIGAGASGLCAAIKLRQAGIPFTLFEKNPEIGGTWYENRYPGCAVDTPNHFYQFSFEPNDDWPHYYSRQRSIYEYLNRCADKYGVRPSIRFNSEVESAAYDEDAHVWHLTVRDGGGERWRVTATVLITAVGQLNRPAIPAIPGLEGFQGTVVHTATWSADTDMRGKRVALIGTGASAVQVGPGIVDDVAALHVFQRSGSWVVRRPNIDRSVGDAKKWALKSIPFYASWYRFQLFWGFADGLFPALRIDPDWQGDGRSINALNERLRQAMLRYIRKELEGRDDLLEKATPTYPPYGKRVLADAGWYRMLRREHVELVNTPIERVEPDAILLKDGERVPVDAIVLATGFQAGRMLWPMDIKGRGGRTIREQWGDSDPRAHLGITVPGFPNLFVLYGPNTNLGHGGSAIFLAECQVRYIMGCLKGMVDRHARSMECRQEAHDAYNERIDTELSQLVWSHPSVNTWYKNGNGRIITNQPWRLVDYWTLTREPDFADYRLE